MRARKPALWLYFSACILTVLAGFLNDDVLMTIAKPVIIPAILFYYLSAKKEPFNIWYGVFLLLTFIGDTLVLMHFQNEILVIMLPYVLSYALLLVFMGRDVARLKFRWGGFAMATFVFFLIVAIAYTLISFLDPGRSGLVLPVAGYGVVLGIQCAMAAYHFHGSSSNMSFYMAMTALFNCVSDIFYVLFTLILSVKHYLGVDLALQVFSYYFVIKYFIFRKR
ncbi:lysoplasmalogenase family protein [Flavobacterium silvaticum]|uniref:Lysoplasmalogenase n=1 Tax=Flavobacterium silvaticum TaxID=1852020 RepID=A0A972FWW4_9FLAO|nr:lysoplasmalogenase family protein [Flavobacterium silvaticum]NMH29135.1 hypothetical protein [Flavobacterium silvaticum]